MLQTIIRDNHIATKFTGSTFCTQLTRLAPTTTGEDVFLSIEAPHPPLLLLMHLSSTNRGICKFSPP